MALWIVRSWGGISTERDGDTDPIVLVGRHRETGPNGDVTVELIETESDEGIGFLRRHPQVISLEPAGDGEFADDTEGKISIANHASYWQPEAAQTEEGRETLLNQQSGRQEVPVKMYRADGRLMVVAPMPGLEPSDLAVEVSPENHLILHGELRGIRQDEKDLLLNEWTVGNYHRELDLPVPVDASMANVTYDNGVLVVTLPVAQQTRPAHLTVPSVGEAHGERVGNSGHPPRPPGQSAQRATRR